MKIRPVGTGFFHVDRRTDVMKLIFAFRNFWICVLLYHVVFKSIKESGNHWFPSNKISHHLLVYFCAMQSNVQPLKPYWSRDEPPVQHSALVRSVYVHILFIWEQTAICATYSINWLVFTTDMKSVYSAVRTRSLNEAVRACAIYSINWLVFTTDMKSVCSAVRTGSLNGAVCACATYSINWLVFITEM
jgi:hypothetical protein